MISIVLYGRNDNYGYNLHKRAALSFNSMAELLQGESDEILFVDYNTPDDFPTFPEAIQDTLSQATRQRLRILRVRPHVHRRFSSKTKLLALEPIARNVAVRRSNPANRWILSTNTDMIFVPRRAASLNEIARDLLPGFYHAPRIEIPETLWEGLDRADGRQAIETVRDWGSALHINEIVLGAPAILYDGPGDFQLMQRSDLFQIHGFHEEMLLGWHVDSNIAQRLTLLRGKVGDLGKEVFGYHCDHTRQVTPAHGPSRTENDWRRFVDAVDRPGIPEQARGWGCADDEIEEIRLTRQSASVYINALKAQIGERQSTPPVAAYIGQNYNKTDYDPRHVLPYLADMFVACERRTNLAWFGTRPDMLARFSGFWKDLGFTGDILVDESLVREPGLASVPRAVGVDLETLLSKADAFVFDFAPVSEREDAVAGLPISVAAAMNVALLRFVKAEHLRIRHGKPPRQVIAVNAINNIFESSMLAHIGAALTPYSTRMRHGFVIPPMEGEVDWTSRLQVGDAGVRDGAHIRSRREMFGVVLHGPYTHLHAGTYRLKVKLSGSASPETSPEAPVAVLEIISQRNYLMHGLIKTSDLVKGEFEISLEVNDALSVSLGFSVQTLLRSLAPIEISISGLSCLQISERESLAPAEGRALAVKEWLPLLWTGPDGVRRNGKIFHRSAKPGILFYGPYWKLPKGSYEAMFVFENGAENSVGQTLARANWQTARAALGARWERYQGERGGVLGVLKLRVGARWKRVREEPIGQLRKLARLLRDRLAWLLGRTSLPRPSDALCTFQAVSQQTELGSQVLSVGDLRTKKQVSLCFTVTTSQLAQPDFAFELRLLAHRQLPFGIKSVTVRRAAG